MSNSSVKNNDDSNNLNTTIFVVVLLIVVIVVVICYFINFNYHMFGHWREIFNINNLSKETGDWGTFGDYVGGILNPIIAAFAFYLIAKTYNLQKKELEATRQLLKGSMDAQNKQIELSVLSTLLNSTLMKVGNLNADIISLHDKLDEYKIKIKLTSNNQEKEFINEEITEFKNAVQSKEKTNNEYKIEIERLEKEVKSIMIKP